MNLDWNVVWIHGAPDCALSTDPPIQVHGLSDDTFIMRQSKCSEPGTPDQPGPSFEAPFIYLLIGRSSALLLDTGASESPAIFPLASTVSLLLSNHAAAHGLPPVKLWVAHSHGHHDHSAGDGQFAGRPNTVVVRPGFEPLLKAFGVAASPNGTAALDLGGRVIDVLPIPGHHDTHIALYDRNTQILLTGDTVYPGLLVVNNWQAYRKSISTLTSFAEANPVSFVLGGHVEMTDRPGEWFGLGAHFQPGEHRLQLSHSHLKELDADLHAIGSTPRTSRHADFIIYAAGLPLPSLTP